MAVAVRWTKYVKFTLWIAGEAKIYCNNFNSSNAVVCSNLIQLDANKLKSLAYTARLAIIIAAELERNGCLSSSSLRNVVLWLKRTSTESLQIEFVTKYDTTMLKRKVVGGPNLRRGVHIRIRIWTGGSKSAVTPALEWVFVESLICKCSLAH